MARLHAAYRDNAAGCVLLLQQLCEGGDMQTLLDTHGPLSESDAASAIEGVLSSLAACHAAGYCYGDVKPANYMLPAMWPSVLHLANPEAPKGQLTTVAIDFGCAQECAQVRRASGRGHVRCLSMLAAWHGQGAGAEAPPPPPLTTYAPCTHTPCTPDVRASLLPPHRAARCTA